MCDDVMMNTDFGRLALKKLAPVQEGFTIYEAGWLGTGNQRQVMEVKGAVFRAAKTGPNKGKHTIIIDGTKRSAFLTREELTEEKLSQEGGA